MKNHSFKTLLIVLSVLMLKSVSMSAQTVTAPGPDQRYINRQHIIDSLNQQVSAMTVTIDSLKQIVTDQRNLNEQQAATIRQLADDNNKLKTEFQDALGQKLQSNHTSSVLFIFNVLVGIFLLVALMWMFMRKKNPVTEDVAEVQIQPRMNGYALPLEHQIDQIEKLGSLRDKGLLTDDEFNLQKRQILGEKH